MSTFQFEAIETPAGAFIGWHDSPGQVVTGEVIDYTPTGGQDFSGSSCPQIALCLVEPCSSFNKAGQRTDFQAGETVFITAGQANLRRGMLAARPWSHPCPIPAPHRRLQAACPARAWAAPHSGAVLRS